MTLLSTVQNAMAMCSLSVPSAVYSSQDDNVRQMVRFLMVAGRDLVKRHDWSALLTARTFTCAATNAQTEPQSDFDRMSRGVQMWNQTSNWPIKGPMNAGEWNELLVRSVVSLPQYWRMIGSVIHIEKPITGNSIGYEYVSNKWIRQAGVTLGTTLTADTDTFVFSEDILERELVWRFKQAKQLDYAEDMRSSERLIAAAMIADQGNARTITTDRHDERPARDRTWHGTITPV